MRAALRKILNLDLDSITRGRAYFDNLSTYAAELLEIYEQANRTQQERESILKEDICSLVSFWGIEQAKVKEWEEDSRSREYNYFRAEWIEDLICQHLCNTGAIGCTLSDETLIELLAGNDYRPALDLSNTSVSDYYPSLNCNTQPPDIPADLPTPNGTDREKMAFRKAIEKGWLIISGEQYKWIGKPFLLGCFVDELYRNLQLPTGLDSWFNKKQVARYSNYYRTNIFAKWDNLNPKMQAKYKPVISLFRK